MPVSTVPQPGACTMLGVDPGGIPAFVNAENAYRLLVAYQQGKGTVGTSLTIAGCSLGRPLGRSLQTPASGSPGDCGRGRVEGREVDQRVALRADLVAFPTMTCHIARER